MESTQTADERRDEAAVLALAKGGDSSAFRVIFELHRNRIYNLVFYHVGDTIVSEDLVQMIFLKVFKGLPAFRHESKLLTWIYRIALNECQNYLKRRGPRYVPFEAILGTEEEMTGEPLPDDLRALNEKREVIRRALMELSPKLRSVIVLKYMDGFSYDDIAAILQCSGGTVASRLNRA
ncbi:MAG: RNA polymerase sigma factor, partial [Blastocatellia bacterium]